MGKYKLKHQNQKPSRQRFLCYRNQKSWIKTLALDLLLLHKRGICGYLNLNNTSVHIPNVTVKSEDQIRSELVAASGRELMAEFESN